MYIENALFKECMEVFADKASIVFDKESKEVIQFFEKTIPLCFLSTDWRKIPTKVKVETADAIISALEALLQNPVDTKVYVFWNDFDLPVIKTDLSTVVNNFNDVICVGFETWFYNPYQGYIIEHRNFHGIQIGLAPVIGISR